MAWLPSALKERMKAFGHTQCDVERLTGVPQPQISKVLKGARKRLTAPMKALCRYAETGESRAAETRISVLAGQLVKAVAKEPSRTEAVESALEGLIALVGPSK
ncbi:helix-turn-helix domain-containing protein [Luteimonas saliphila]|uniref:helix-turn-helix domain-containing protein n=1 Tax=Luteimonas saliphila TaxID=2804919 RepID=UPI00192D3855|nr:hypothetical protein [Luteimonas saliphila]